MTMGNQILPSTKRLSQKNIPGTEINADYLYDILSRLIPNINSPDIRSKLDIEEIISRGFYSTVIIIKLKESLTIGEHNLAKGVQLVLKTPKDSEHKGAFIHEYKMLKLASITGFTPFPFAQDEESRAILMSYQKGNELLSHEDYNYSALRGKIHKIAEAVDTLFAYGIIHCDPSMGNILQTERGILILDFGASVSERDLNPHFFEISSNIRPFGVISGQVTQLLDFIFDSTYYNSYFRMALASNNISFFGRYKAFMTLVWALHLFNALLGTKGLASLENWCIPLINFNGIACSVNSNATKFIAEKFNLPETHIEAWLKNIADFANEIINLQSSNWSFTVQSILSGLFFVEG